MLYYDYTPVAQWIERNTPDVEVEGSNPFGRAIFFVFSTRTKGFYSTKRNARTKREVLVKKYSRFFLLFVGLLFFVGCEKKEDSASQTKITDMASYVETKCSMCHFSSRIFKEPRTAEEWKRLVPRMRSINPQLLSPEDVERILNYLVANTSISEKEKTASGE